MEEPYGPEISRPVYISPEVPQHGRFNAVKVTRNGIGRVWGVGDFVDIQTYTEKPIVARIRAIWKEYHKILVCAQRLYRYEDLMVSVEASDNELVWSNDNLICDGSKILRANRVGIVDPSKRASITVSALYADEENFDASGIPPRYTCGFFVKDLNSKAIIRLSPDQYKDLITLPSRALSVPGESDLSPQQWDMLKNMPKDDIDIREAVEHAFYCAFSSGSCKIKYCHLVKGVHNHTKKCKLNDCFKCKLLDGWVFLHSKTCTVKLGSCKIPRCNESKPSFLIEHASDCHKETCDFPRCNFAKILLKHARSPCDVSSCIRCDGFQSALSSHEMSCSQNGCIYPKCPNYSRTLSHGEQSLECVIPDCTKCWLFKKLLLLHNDTKCTPGRCHFPHCNRSKDGTIAPLTLAPSQTMGSQTIKSQQANVVPEHPASTQVKNEHLVTTPLSEEPNASRFSLTAQATKGTTITPSQANASSEAKGLINPLVIEPSTAKSSVNKAEEIPAITDTSNHLTSYAPPVSADSESNTIPRADQEILVTRPSLKRQRVTSSSPKAENDVSIRSVQAAKEFKLISSLNTKSLHGSSHIIQRGHRIGEEFQAEIPKLIKKQTGFCEKYEDILWKPHTISNVVVKAELEKRMKALLSKRGSAVQVCLSQNRRHTVWVRIAQPSSTPSGKTRVVPADICWPKTGSCDSFVVPCSSWLFDVDQTMFIPPNAIEEQVLYSSYRQSKNESQTQLEEPSGLEQSLGTWTEKEYDQYTQTLKSSVSMHVRPKLCNKSANEFVEFMYYPPLIHTKGLPTMYQPCSNCQKKSEEPYMVCRRFFQCRNILCTSCVRTKDIDLNEDPEASFFCTTCLLNITVSDQPNGNISYLSSSRISTEIPDIGSRKKKKMYTDNESIFRDYDSEKISAEDALDRIRDLLIEKSKQTLNLLSLNG